MMQKLDKLAWLRWHNNFHNVKNVNAESDVVLYNYYQAQVYVAAVQCTNVPYREVADTMARANFFILWTRREYLVMKC